MMITSLLASGVAWLLLCRLSLAFMSSDDFNKLPPDWLLLPGAIPHMVREELAWSVFKADIAMTTGRRLERGRSRE
jgi:hypothetical protein